MTMKNHHYIEGFSYKSPKTSLDWNQPEVHGYIKRSLVIRVDSMKRTLITLKGPCILYVLLYFQEKHVFIKLKIND